MSLRNASQYLANTSHMRFRYAKDSLKQDCEFGPRYKIVTLADIMEDDDGDEDDDGTNVSILVLLPMYYKGSKMTKNTQASWFNKNSRNTGTLNFDRIGVFYDPFAPEGENTVTMLFGCGQNKYVFQSHLNERDTGVFREKQEIP